MNKINYLTHKLLTGAVALALVALIAQANAESVAQKVTVTKVSGSARYMVAGGSWMALHSGDVLPPGSVIETAAKSTVDIALGTDQGGVGGGAVTPISMPAMGGGSGGGASAGARANTIRVYESSVLSIDKLTSDKTGMDEVSETSLDLRAGKIMGNVKKLSAASHYEVKIPNGVAGIRGTTYIIDATTGQIWVLDGEVDVVYQVGPNMVSEKITAGMTSSPTSPTPTQGNPPSGTDTKPIPAPGTPVITETVNNGTLLKISNN